MVKIFGTFGPSCQSQEILEKMIQEGMNGMRLNLSHTSLEESRKKIERYQACRTNPEEREIIIDLHGPEIRTGYLKETIVLSRGTEFILKSKRSGETLPVVSVPPAFLEALEPGDEILFRDGQIRAQVISELEPSSCPDPEKEEGKILLTVGSFALYFPWDVHIPAVQAGDAPAAIRKIVIKVPMEACI